MNTIMQLRKICNHPYMFQHIEVTYRNSISIEQSFLCLSCTQSEINIWFCFVHFTGIFLWASWLFWWNRDWVCLNIYLYLYMYVLDLHSLWGCGYVLLTGLLLFMLPPQTWLVPRFWEVWVAGSHPAQVEGHQPQSAAFLSNDLTHDHHGGLLCIPQLQVPASWW